MRQLIGLYFLSVVRDRDPSTLSRDVRSVIQEDLARCNNSAIGDGVVNVDEPRPSVRESLKRTFASLIRGNSDGSSLEDIASAESHARVVASNLQKKSGTTSDEGSCHAIL